MMPTPRIALLASAVALAGVAPPALAARAARPVCATEACGTSMLVYVGTRGTGAGRGITAARFDPATGRLAGLGLAAEVVSPTWLVPSPHRPILYAVSEVGNDGREQASVLSFMADARTGRLDRIGKVASGGGGATFLAMNDKAMPPSILVANYGTGQVGVVPLGHAGVVSAAVSVQAEQGSGPGPRQRGSHPHGIAIDPTGRFVLVADLGADRIFVHPFDPATRTLGPAEPGSAAVPPGSGPRHVVFHPNGRFVYANAELSGDVMLFGWDGVAARLSLLATFHTRAPGYAGELSSAELALSPDGRFLYLTNRGEDDVIVFAVDQARGTLAEVQRLASGGKAPASFAIDPSGRWLAIANAGSDLVTMFARDPVTGRLRPTRRSLAVGNPVSIAFLLR